MSTVTVLLCACAVVMTSAAAECGEGEKCAADKDNAALLQSSVLLHGGSNEVATLEASSATEPQADNANCDYKWNDGSPAWSLCIADIKCRWKNNKCEKQVDCSARSISACDPGFNGAMNGEDPCMRKAEKCVVGCRTYTDQSHCVKNIDCRWRWAGYGMTNGWYCMGSYQEVYIGGDNQCHWYVNGKCTLREVYGGRRVMRPEYMIKEHLKDDNSQWATCGGGGNNCFRGYGSESIYLHLNGAASASGSFLKAAVEVALKCTHKETVWVQVQDPTGAKSTVTGWNTNAKLELFFDDKDVTNTMRNTAHWGFKEYQLTSSPAHKRPILRIQVSRVNANAAATFRANVIVNRASVSVDGCMTNKANRKQCLADMEKSHRDTTLRSNHKEQATCLKNSGGSSACLAWKACLNDEAKEMILAVEDAFGDGEACHALVFGQNSGAEYELAIPLTNAAAGTYIISALVKVSSDYNGQPRMIHSRWYTSSSGVIGTTSGLENGAWPAVRDEWERVTVSFNTGSAVPARLTWYVGYPQRNTAGSVAITALQVQAPDGTLLLSDGNFPAGADMSTHHSSGSYGTYAIKKVPCQRPQAVNDLAVAITGCWKKKDDDLGKYVSIPNGQQGCSSDPNADSIKIGITCANAGTTKVSALIIAPTGNDDSVRIKVDNGNRIDWHTGRGSSWFWSGPSPGIATNAGAQFLYILKREDGIQIKEIKLEGACKLQGLNSVGNYVVKHTSGACNGAYLPSGSGILADLDACQSRCDVTSTCAFVSFCPSGTSACTGGNANKCALYSTCTSSASQYSGYTTYKYQEATSLLQQNPSLLQQNRATTGQPQQEARCAGSSEYAQLNDCKCGHHGTCLDPYSLDIESFDCACLDDIKVMSSNDLHRHLCGRVDICCDWKISEGCTDRTPWRGGTLTASIAQTAETDRITNNMSTRSHAEDAVSLDDSLAGKRTTDAPKC